MFDGSLSIFQGSICGDPITVDKVHTGQEKVSEKLFFSKSGKSQGIL